MSLLAALFAISLGIATAFSTVPLPTSLPSTSPLFVNPKLSGRGRSVSPLYAEASSEVSAPAPVLDGKRVLPLKVMKAGLKGHKVAAVYALLNSDYKRGCVT